jgi:hypothetical protein
LDYLSQAPGTIAIQATGRLPVRKKKYPEDELVEAIKTSRSIRQALMKVGIAPYGGNYATVRMLIKKYDIDTSHMMGWGWNKGDTLGLATGYTIPLEMILVEDSSYTNTSRLRARLIAAGLKNAVCEKCGLTEWNSEKISLELNHINGDRFDHRIDNLQLLCPNCHAQTHTYRGKNMGNGARRI